MHSIDMSLFKKRKIDFKLNRKNLKKCMHKIFLCTYTWYGKMVKFLIQIQYFFQNFKIDCESDKFEANKLHH